MASRLAPEPEKTKKTRPKKEKVLKAEKPASNGKKGKGGLIAGIAAAAVVVILGGGYCGLSAMASGSEVLYRNTTVNGVDISGLTAQQAVDVLDTALEGMTEVDGVHYDAIELIAEETGDTYTLDLSDALGYDTQGMVAEIYSAQHDVSFLRAGAVYLSGGSDYTLIPGVVSDEEVTDALEACGVLELNTTVDTECEVGEDGLIIRKGISGYSVDQDALVQRVLDNTALGDYTPITCPMIAAAPEAVDLQAIYDEVYAEPSDATIDLAEDYSYTIVESVQGVSFDVAAVTAQIEAAAEGAELSIPYTLTEPELTTEELQECLFRDVLGQYTTTVSGSSSRRSNVKLAGSKCDGIILMPGDVFSYNGAVGQRTLEAGFKEAPAYVDGETVQEVGGGVCQPSSTLYSACLYANLEIVERHNHSYISSYIGLGMDATVYYGALDYQFRNNTDYPIKIVCIYENDRITFQLLGTDVNHYSVEITAETLETMSPPVKEVEDSTLPVGTTVVESSGHSGARVQTYRAVYDSDGSLISKTEEAYSYYKTSDKIVHVGTKAEESKTETPTETTGDSGETTDSAAETGGETTGGETITDVITDLVGGGE